MKRSAYLVNTSRGPVVDEEALAWALRERLIAGAALDVYEREPAVHPELLALENVVLAPHLGSATVETRTAMADLAARNVLAVLSGGTPPLRRQAARMTEAAQPRDVEWMMRGLARAITGLELPIVEKIAEEQREDAFQVLIATLLSARTQDATTAAASERLFATAPTPRRMAALTVREIAKLIYPVSFYRTKAKHVKATCRILLDAFGGACLARWTNCSTCQASGARPRTWC